MQEALLERCFDVAEGGVCMWVYIRPTLSMLGW